MKFKLKPIASAVLFSIYISAPSYVIAQETDTPKSENLIEEIIVIGTGREENIQEVPISETVFTEQTIQDAGIDQVDDFLALTPGVTFSNSQDSGTNFISIRGLSQVRNGEAPVAVVIDGVLQTNSRSFDQPLFDISSVEVLRGPQGALYGRNATGGAIIIQTKKPTDETEGYVQVGIGQGDLTTIEGSVAGGISERVSGRISARVKDFEGVYDNFVLGNTVDFAEETALRGHLNFEISDSVWADLRGSIVNTEGGALAFTLQPVPVDPVTGFAIGFDPTRVGADNVETNFSSNIRGVDDRETKQLSLRVGADLGYATFQSVTAYDQLTQVNFGDAPPYTADLGGIQAQNVDVESLSQEFRLTSNGDNAFRWLVGAYYLDTNRFIATTNYADLGTGLPVFSQAPINTITAPLTSYIADDNDNSAWALFFNTDYDLTDRLELSVSGRYDKDKREQAVSSAQGAYNAGVVVAPIGVPGSVNTEEFSLFQPKVSLSYAASDSLNLYTSWGKGFRSGQFNPNGVGPIAAGAGIAGVGDVLDQEETSTFELGAKKSWADGRYTLNSAIYQNEVENAPYFVFIPAVGAQILVPIDEIDVFGAEVEFNASLTDAWDFYASASFTDSEVKAFSVNPTAVGNEAPYIADSTFNAGLQYRTQITSGLNLLARADIEQRGEQFWSPENLQPRSSFTLANLRLGLEDVNAKWSVTASLDNAFDEEYNAEFVLPFFAFAGKPRLWRLEARYNF